MARPRKPTGTRKDEVIRIRVTEEQRQLFARAAERDGRDVSSWLRNLGVRAAQQEEGLGAQETAPAAALDPGKGP